MPYIERERRKILDPYIDKLIELAERIGELNYIATRICDGYISKYSDSDGIDYGACNAIIGVLDCAKEEFRRRRLNPLEDKKKKENGDVYE